MQLIWLVPSLGFSLYLGFAMGQWAAAFLALTTFLLFAAILVVKNLRTPLAADALIHFGSSRVAIGNHVLPRWTLLWKPELRERVWKAAEAEIDLEQARLVLNNFRLNDFAVPGAESSDLSFIAGFNGSSPKVLSLNRDGPHTLIIGSTGAGKSQFLKHLVGSVLATANLQPPLLYLVDYKGGAALRQFVSGSSFVALATDLDEELIGVLDGVLHEMKMREQLQVDNPNFVLRKILLVIDEFGSAIAVSGALLKLESILARGRSLGVHVIATHQSTNGIPRALLVNFGMRVALGRLDAVDAAQLGFSQIRNPIENSRICDTRLIDAQILTTSSQFQILFPAPDKLDSETFSSAASQKVLHKQQYATESVALTGKRNDFRSSF